MWFLVVVMTLVSGMDPMHILIHDAKPLASEQECLETMAAIGRMQKGTEMEGQVIYCVYRPRKTE